MKLLEIVNWRYSTKEFSDKKIPEEIWKEIEHGLRFSASSTNAQPWHFIIASTEEGKKRLAKGTEKFSFNTEKVLNASHVVLFCSKTTLDENYLLNVLEKEDKDGRYEQKEFKEQMHGARKMFVDLHKDEFKDLEHWNEKQTYLSVGSTLVGSAVLGIDSVPMEGIDIEELNKEFKLEDKGLSASVMVSFGYRKEEDFNSKLPKSRLSEEEIFTKI